MKPISVDAKVTENCETLIVTMDDESLNNIGRVIVDDGYNCKVFYEDCHGSVPVIQCKDCQYADESNEKDKYEYLCKKYNLYIHNYKNVYCQYGERRSDDE